MATRKKPTGQEWKDFVKKYNSYNHEGKLELASSYGVTYDVLRHWKLEGDTTPRQLPLPEPEEVKITPDLVGEILATRSKTQLDFVSLDIETTNLNADSSIMLCAFIKPFGQEPMHWRADDYPTWESQRHDDSPIVTDVANELGKHAVVITHYGTGFDIPYLRAKMTRYSLPPLPPMFAVDTYAIAKNNFRVSRRSLANLVEYFAVGKKGGISWSEWLKAGISGSSEALDEIVAHCRVDVEVLEKLAMIGFPYLRSMRRL